MQNLEHCEKSSFLFTKTIFNTDVNTKEMKPVTKIHRNEFVTGLNKNNETEFYKLNNEGEYEKISESQYNEELSKYNCAPNFSFSGEIHPVLMNKKK